jgi:hypothetical protein
MYNPRFLDLGTRWRWVISFTPSHLTLWEKAPISHYIGGWVDTKAVLNDMDKWKFLNLPGLELRESSPVASRHTDCATAPLNVNGKLHILMQQFVWSSRKRPTEFVQYEPIHSRLFLACSLTLRNRSWINLSYARVCLVESESRGETSAVGGRNPDNSYDYGPFQVRSTETLRSCKSLTTKLSWVSMTGTDILVH